MNAWRTQLVAVVLAVGLGAVYLRTLAPGPTWGDGLEFATVVHVLGIPHPTGYPLYVMLGKLWELAIPIGSVALRLNLLSALLGVLAALLLFGAVREALPEEEEKKWEDVPQPHHWRRVLIAAGTAMAWGLTPAIWQQATVAEVYTLFAVFLHGLTWLMLKNMRLKRHRLDLLIAFVFGLALTHHRLIVVLAPAVVGYAIHRLRILHRPPQEQPLPGLQLHPWRPPSRPAWLLLCALAFGLGLLPILYLPLRARMGPAINWGDPSTPERLWWVLSGGEYRITRLLATEGRAWSSAELWANIGARLSLALRLLLGEFVPLAWRSETFAVFIAALLLLLMAIGWWRTRPALRWAIPVTAGLTLAAVSVYNIADFQAYLLPAISAGWFWLALGVLWAAEWVEMIFLRRRFTYTALVLGLLPMWLGFRFWPICDRSHDERADEWATRVLAEIPAGSLLLTRGDGDTYAMWYAQHVLGLRADVTVFATNFMWSGWYRDFFGEEEAGHLHVEDLDGPAEAPYYLLALVGGVIAPNLAAGREVYACFNPYESPEAELVSLWERLYGGLKYDILFLGHTRDPDRPSSAVEPPDNPLLPPGFVESMRRLGEPAPQLYRILDNPALTRLATERFATEAAGGHRAWRLRQSGRLFGPLPLERVLEQSP